MKQIFIIFAIFLFASNTKAQSSIQPSSASVCTITIENGTSPKLTTENCISTDAEIIQKGTKTIIKIPLPTFYSTSSTSTSVICGTNGNCK